jgi:MFS family permease
MTFGPLIVALALLLMMRIGPESSYLIDILPAVIILGLGLALTVAPLTAAVLAAAETRHAGVASGVNNAVARTAGLLAVAVLPLVMGLSGDDYQQPVPLADGFRVAMTWCAGLVAVSALIAWFGIRDDVLVEPPADEVITRSRTPKPVALPADCYHCSLNAPPPPDSVRTADRR